MEICPQCNIPVNTANSRLIRDACGHVKCRLCLVLEEDGCVACGETGKDKTVVEDESPHSNDSSPGDDQQQEDKEQVSPSRKKRTKEPTVRKKFPIVAQEHIVVLPGCPVRYHCTACNKIFGAKYSIPYHNYCGAEKKPFQCEVCNKGFITKSHYNYHLLTHSGSEPFVCSKCNKTFKQKAKLNQHMKLHDGERPFICQECGKGFATAAALNCHRRIHTGEKPYVCETCSKAFTEASNYKKHLRIHTAEKPFMCEECGKSYSLKRSLNIHLLIHSRERNHVCGTCNRGFAMKTDLKRHLIVHSGDRPYSCSTCQLKFRRKDNLERHIRNTHLDSSVAEDTQQQTKSTVSNAEPAASGTEPDTGSANKEQLPADETSVSKQKVSSPTEETASVKDKPPEDKAQPPTVLARREGSETIIQSTPAESVDIQPREAFRAVPVINRSMTSSLALDINNSKNSDTPVVEGANCVRTITRASSSGKTVTESVIKSKLECYQVLERPEIFKTLESQRTKQPSLRMLLSDVDCSDNIGTVLNLAQNTQYPRTEPVPEDFVITDNSRYDRTISRSFPDTYLPEMYHPDFLSSYEMNRRRLIHPEDDNSPYRLGNVSYDQFMGSPYLVGDLRNYNPSSYVQPEEEVSGRLKMLADVAGTKDPSGQVSQVIVGAKKSFTSVLNPNMNF